MLNKDWLVLEGKSHQRELGEGPIHPFCNFILHRSVERIEGGIELHNALET